MVERKRFGLYNALESLTTGFFQVEYSGLEHWRGITGGPLIVYFNHQSHADSVFVYSTVPPQLRGKVRIPKNESYWDRPFFSQLSGLLPTIPLDTDHYDKRSLDEMVEWLKSGGIVQISPEGTRSRNGELGPFKRGVAALARLTGAEAIPVGISKEVWHDFGPGTLIPKGRGPVRVSVGEPLTFKAQEGESNKAFGLRILEEMKVALGDLIE